MLSFSPMTICINFNHENGEKFYDIKEFAVGQVSNHLV